MKLIVALDAEDSAGGESRGTLFWDDGLSIGKCLFSWCLSHTQSVSRGRVCLVNFVCFHSKTEVAD